MKEEQHNLNTNNIRPWVRYLARTIDSSIVGFAFGLMSPLISMIFNIQILNLNSHLLGFLILFLYIFIEPIFLILCGNTFGKWLLKIKLKDSTGKNLIFSTAFKRSFFVWLYGFGAGIPIISLLTLKDGYSNLVKNGITSWDKKYNLVISHEKIGTARVIIAISLLGLLISLSFIE